MDCGKLKITFGDLNVELEGDNELLARSFSDMLNAGSFRVSGTFNAIENRISSAAQNVNSQLIPSPEKECDTEIIEITNQVPTADLPDFNSLILEKKSFSASAWMLLMAWSVSHKGRIRFTKKQIRKIYCNSSKHIGLRSKDFVSNFMLLLLNDYVLMVDKNTFELTEYGYRQAYALLSETEKSNLSEAI